MRLFLSNIALSTVLDLRLARSTVLDLSAKAYTVRVIFGTLH